MEADGGVDEEGSWRDGLVKARLWASGVVDHVFVLAIGARKPVPLGAFSLPRRRPSAARPGRGTSHCARRIIELADCLFHPRKWSVRENAEFGRVRAR
jgi:hypothetical protein